jgi:F-type H+-transporting ATPase subunit delta
VGVVEQKYALALYEAALDKGRVAEVQRDLADFVKAEHEVPELRKVLASPTLNSASKEALLVELMAGSEPLVRNFLRLLAEKDRGSLLEEIAREFEALVATAGRRLRVVVTTAQELSEEEAGALVAKIEAATGRPVDAERRVDPSLIGGLVVQAGSLRMDTSIRGRIENLRKELVETRS